jgi:hypothetical protein
MADNKPSPKLKLQLTPSSGMPVAALTPLPEDSPTKAIPPELVEIFKAALETLPPNTVTRLLRKHWVWVLGLIAPLALTTYQSVKNIIEGPAQVAALVTSTAQDHADIAQLRKDLSNIDTKLDRVIWLMQTQSGAKIYPPSAPNIP